MEVIFLVTDKHCVLNNLKNTFIVRKTITSVNLSLQYISYIFLYKQTESRHLLPMIEVISLKSAVT